MNTKICTSIEQSKKLLNLGLDPSMADMCWKMANPDLPTLIAIPYDDTDKNIVVNALPAWSLTAILELIPPTIKDDFSKCVFQMSKYDKGYQLSYVREGNHYCAIWSCCKELVVDAAFEMVCFLLRRGNIKEIRKV